MLLPRATLVVIGALLASRDLSAQGIIGGRTLFAGTDQPLACISVALVTERDSMIARTRSRADGSFDLMAPAVPGLYRLYFVGLGFDPIDSDTIRLDANTDFDIPFRLALTMTRGTRTILADNFLHIDLEPRARRGTGTLKYPEELRNEAYEGQVTMGFAIDTLGRVDPRTAVVLGSTHPLFTAAVRSALASIRYDPAQYSGARQCLFVTQEFRFALQRNE